MLMRAAVVLVTGCAVLLSGCQTSSDGVSEPHPPDATQLAEVIDSEPAAEPSDCPVAPVLHVAQTARLSLRVSTEFEGEPIAIGQSKPDVAGGTYGLTFFVYYVGNFHVLDSAGNAYRANLVDANDVPLPYGLQLINLDDEATWQLRLATPKGEFEALSFSVGVHQTCNEIPLEQRIWPMSIETEMNWGWTMLNMRLEGSRHYGQRSQLLMFHLGFPQEYTFVRVPGPLALTSRSVERTLSFAVDRALGADTPSVVPLQEQFVLNLAAAGTFVLR